MKILIAEDQADLRESIAARLRAKGHRVDQTCKLAETRDQLSIEAYSVVILDRMLPDGDAIDLVDALRARCDTTPILLLTARDQISDRVEGLQAGADDYLVKPFAMDELLARVATLSRRRHDIRASVLEVGDVAIDLGRREVRRSGTLLPLRPKEFAVLELLAERKGRIVSRGDLIEACWDEAYEPSSNVEEVVIASLRRKLGKPAVIHTVRGAGYLLEARDEDD